MRVSLSSLSFAVFLVLGVTLVACGDDDVVPPPVDGGPLDGNAADLGGGGDDGGGATCVGAGDGTACESPTGVAAICVSGVCTESSCGDSIVDVRTEACDDGNMDPGDGCEPATCAFTCAADSECTNGNDCDGTETCVLALHRCQLGTPPAVGAACMTAAGVAGQCNAAVVCGPAGCGNSIVGAGEDCDDGNAVDGDGCDGDCTFSCTTAADCDDANVCTGTETCTIATHTCVAGAALDCADASACTANNCDPMAGCQNPLIDGDGDGQAATTLGACGTDCDDANAARYVGAEELCDGIDNNCNSMTDEVAPTWYVDCDADTYAASLVGAMAGCVAPSAAATGCPVTSARAWTNRRPIDTTTTDCYDANASVKPGQLSYFSTAASGRSASVDFDYNCNGTEEKRYPVGLVSLPRCSLDSRGNCSGSTFWTAATAPACGASGTLRVCQADRGGTCYITSGTLTVQTCR